MIHTMEAMGGKSSTVGAWKEVGKGIVGWAAKAPARFLAVYYNRIPLPPSPSLHVGMRLSAIPLGRRIYVASKQVL